MLELYSQSQAFLIQFCHMIRNELGWSC